MLGTLRTHLDIVLPYFLAYADDQQRRRWFGGLASGELFGAIAMTEPGTGSDLAGVRTSAVRDGDQYVVSGAQDVHHRRAAGRPGHRGRADQRR
jgi:acyl-CoA dehydrogenase